MTVTIPEWVIHVAAWSLWGLIVMLAAIGLVVIVTCLKFRNTELFKINW